MRAFGTSVLALTALLAVPHAWAQETPPPETKDKEPSAEDAAKPPNFREEVVVTAQKRTEAVQEIPASVTVLGGELMEQQRADDFQDLVPLVPTWVSAPANRRACASIRETRSSS